MTNVTLTSVTPTNVTLKCGCCFIIPLSVLRKLAQAEHTITADRGRYQRSYAMTQKLRLVREGHRQASLSSHQSGLSLRATAVAKVPVEHLFDCQHNTTLPGTAVPTPNDPAFKTVFDTTAKVAEFYKTVLGRNSVDNQGMDLVSSLNYDQDYQNAFWDGQQMVYGNGDNKIFIDFWRSPDVIGHELTHGVTQHESGLIYEGQSGALNESISDCFGAAFAQWLAKKPASDAGGWLIGAGIMGPDAKAKGFTCLRDMVNPGAAHCLSQQPGSFKDFDPTGDVHDNSGIPNRAFAVFAQSLGGNTYDLAIKVWYDACVSGLSSRATFADFAQATVAAAQKKGPAVAKAATDAWQAVDLSVGAPGAALAA
ncbi:MAG TPA: M4 family metallopeptidase [Reyranella sp.]|jgi:Zn-dependent metalloprotease